MAIAGSGGWIPSVRVCIRHRTLKQAQIAHNVPQEACWMPEQAAAKFIDDPHAYIYVSIRDGGGLDYLYDLLVELDLIDPIDKPVVWKYA